MSASRKKRIARLIAVLDAAEQTARDRRWKLRVLNCICKDIRAAMEWRGIDAASALVLLNAEAELAGFVDTPESFSADMDSEDDADEEGSPDDEDPPDDADPWQWFHQEADRLGKPFLDGSRPDFKRGSLGDLWGWALTQYSLVPAVAYDFSAGGPCFPGSG
jgi:hypothetical protein